MATDDLQAVLIILASTAFSTILTIFIAKWPKIAEKRRRQREATISLDASSSSDITEITEITDILADEFVGPKSVPQWRSVKVKFEVETRSICLLHPDGDKPTALRKITFALPHQQTFQRFLRQAVESSKSSQWHAVHQAAEQRVMKVQQRWKDEPLVLQDAGTVVALQLRHDADLVLMFKDINKAKNFKEEVTAFFRNSSIGKYIYRNPVTINTLMKQNFDLEHFRSLLVAGVRSVFFGGPVLRGEAHERLRNSLTSEITLEELNVLLRTPQDHRYTVKLFEQIDQNHSGFISVWQLLKRFSKFSFQQQRERLLSIFQLFDSNHDGVLTYEEFSELVSSFFPRKKLTSEWVTNFFENVISTSLNGRQSDQIAVSFECFWLHFPIEKLEPDRRVTTPAREASPISLSCHLEPDPLVLQQEQIDTANFAQRFKDSIFANRRQLFWSTIYAQLIFCVILVELIKSSRNLVTACCGNVATLTLCSLFLLRMRLTLTKLRNTDLRYVFPFASLGTASKNLARLHFIACVVQGALVAPRLQWGSLFIVFVHLISFAATFFQTKKIPEMFLLVGVLLSFCLEIFRFSNSTATSFHYFFVVVTFLFLVADQICCHFNRYSGVKLVASYLSPTGVLRLDLEKPSKLANELKAGQYINLSVPSVERDEFRPFSLTSSPNEDNISVHLVAAGPWTKQIVQQLASYRLPPTVVDIEGPFSGVGCENWHQCDVAVFIGKSICATPFASLLKHIGHEIANTKTNDGILPFKCQKAYFIFVTDKLSEWFDDEVIEVVERVDDGSFVSVETFVAEAESNYDLRTIVIYREERRSDRELYGSRNAFTRLRTRQHFGRPNFDRIFQRILQHNDGARLVHVFTSAPPSFILQVEQAVKRIDTALTAPVFQHHYEAF